MRIGIRRAMRYSTMNVPHETASGDTTGVLPMPRGFGVTPMSGKTDMKPGAEIKGIPVPSGSSMQSGMNTDMPKDQPVGGATF